VFFLTYLSHELLRRKRQTIAVALGLAISIGLVVTIAAASSGVQQAQSAVLQALYGIGTDVTVTTTPPKPPKPGSKEAASYAFTPGDTAQSQDLLGLPPGLGLLKSSSVTDVAGIDKVNSAVGGLSLQNTKIIVPAKSQLGANGEPPPSSKPTTSTVDGVDPAHTGLGPYASAAISSGRTLAAADAGKNVAVVDSDYAAANRITVGSKVIIKKVAFDVIGLGVQPQGGGAANIYIPLDRAQDLSAFQKLKNLDGYVNTIYVKVSGSSSIAGVRAQISRQLPAATVTSLTSLADAVSGSLASAAQLAANLGRWLAIASLIAAFLVAALLTMAAVTRRVRELGTLKALGWRTGRIVRQLMAECAVTGIIGAVIGIAIGYGGAALVRILAPALSATVASNPGSAPPENITIDGSGMHREIAPGGTHTVIVHLTAPVTLITIVLAVTLAVAGGLISGSLAAWRAGQLRPADALRRAD
jgi:putative ABC transport system permease protein